MTDDLWAYVAGPYTGGDGGASVIANTRAALEAGERVREMGLVPVVPHVFTLGWELVHHHEYSWWIDLTCAWLKRCDIVLRLPGPSKGSDIETALAKCEHIPVVNSLGDLDEWATKERHVRQHGEDDAWEIRT